MSEHRSEVRLGHELVERARTNATANGLATRAEFVAADLYSARDDAASRALDGADAVLIDPPRTGAGAVLPSIGASKARRIAYVSCHPVSFARDAAALRAHGFVLERVGVFDMFPHTTHVEALGLSRSGVSRRPQPAKSRRGRC